MMMRLRRRDAGNATALALIATFLVAALASGLASVSLKINETGANLDSTVLAGYAAEAGLEQVKAAISTSEYPPGEGNVWLRDNAIAFDPDRQDFALPTDPKAIADLIIGRLGRDRMDVVVDVWVYAMDDDSRKYRAVARGWVTDPGLPEAERRARDIQVVLAQDIRARDTFARFATFVDEGTLRFGKTSVKGDVHSNENIEFHYGGAQFLDRVTATSGFNFENGANADNTTFRDQNRFSSRIELPTVTDVTSFGDVATGAYNVRGSNLEYAAPTDTLNARIELLGDKVRITAVSQKTGDVVKDQILPLPAEGVIYVEGNITSIQGKMAGRTTISASGTINVTGDILYTDTKGNSAMRLEKDGEPVDPSSLPAGTAWKEEDGYRYLPNPEFPLDGPDRPALGLMAGYDITLDGAGPQNLEIHAALFSAASSWKADLAVEKGNLRILGSITTKKPGARAQGSKGYAASGEYVYDASLLDNPPPHWLQVDSPFWGPRWRMGW
jgi:hypothetical protein